LKPQASSPEDAIRSRHDGRLPFIHGLRGIAALSVLAFHFFGFTPLEHQVGKALPVLLHSIMRFGFVGVDIFFIISGFVIALTLYGRVRSFRQWGLFFVRRQLRLDPPYWVAIALSIVSAILVNKIKPAIGASTPSLTEVLAHLLYLEDILGIKEIVGVFWTLCLEVQFYLVYGGLVLVFSRFKASAGMFAWSMLPLYATSLACFLGLLPTPRGLFIDRWFEFFTGVQLFLLWRKATSPMHMSMYLTMLVAAFLASLRQPSDDVNHIQVTLIAEFLLSALFMLAISRQGFQRWLAHPLFVYFGSISYSLYLMHAVVGVRFLHVFVHPTDSPIFVWAAIVLGFILTLAASDLMYRFVEKPSIQLSQKFKERHRTGPSVTSLRLDAT
jgi:peptidoglycan/LPS O-acetylase OafA/YrhL